MKSGFDCPVKFRTIQTGSKMMTYKQENVDHKHDRVEDIQRKNFNFSVEVEAKMMEMLEMNVNSRNMRKHLIGKGYYTEADAPSDQAFYSKTNKLRKKLNLDRRTIGLIEFEDLILEYSVERYLRTLTSLTLSSRQSLLKIRQESSGTPSCSRPKTLLRNT